jgi:hypothetical protein
MDFSRYHANNCCPATCTTARAGNFQVNAQQTFSKTAATVALAARC